jgi:tetratricopeptide (TPR) repeat protein
MTLAWVGWALNDSFVRGSEPGQLEYFAGNKLFEDGEYERALREYDKSLEIDPENIHALRGRARSLMQLGRLQAALAAFNEAIARQPDFGGTYANRGILYDRMGEYKKALSDYEKAMQLTEEVTAGPNWLTRFLRKQPKKPPTVADRARYLREQLAKPESERVLRNPEVDAAQRPYKQ